MAIVIEGTTPTISYQFDTVLVANISVATLTIKKGGSIVITKQLADAYVDADENALSWTLTQQETLSLGENETCEAMLNWKSGMTRGVGDKFQFMIGENHIKEVI